MKQESEHYKYMVTRINELEQQNKEMKEVFEKLMETDLFKSNFQYTITVINSILSKGQVEGLYQQDGPTYNIEWIQDFLKKKNNCD